MALMPDSKVRAVTVETATIKYAIESLQLRPERLTYFEQAKHDVNSLVRGLALQLDSHKKVVSESKATLVFLKAPVTIREAFYDLWRLVCVRWLPSFAKEPRSFTYEVTHQTITEYLCPHRKLSSTHGVHEFYLAGESCYEGSQAEWENLRTIADETRAIVFDHKEPSTAFRRALYCYDAKQKDPT